MLILKDFLDAFFKKKYKFISINIATAAFSILIALNLPNKYIASAVLVPIDNSKQLSSSLDVFSNLSGGLTDFAGIDLPTSGSNVSDYAFASLNSMEIIRELMEIETFRENIFASKRVNLKTGEISYTKSLFNSEEGKWVRNPKGTQKVIPSYQEIYEKKLKYDLEITQDRKTKFISVSFEHISPNFAYEFLNAFISKANNIAREKDILTSERAIEFLNEQYYLIENKNALDTLSKLKEDQLKTLMLANVNENYLLKPIGPVFIPEIKSSPNRPLLCILITLFGIIFSSLWVILSDHKINKALRKYLDI